MSRVALIHNIPTRICPAHGCHTVWPCELHPQFDRVEPATGPIVVDGKVLPVQTPGEVLHHKGRETPGNRGTCTHGYHSCSKCYEDKLVTRRTAWLKAVRSGRFGPHAEGSLDRAIIGTSLVFSVTVDRRHASVSRSESDFIGATRAMVFSAVEGELRNLLHRAREKDEAPRRGQVLRREDFVEAKPQGNRYRCQRCNGQVANCVTHPQIPETVMICKDCAVPAVQSVMPLAPLAMLEHLNWHPGRKRWEVPRAVWLKHEPPGGWPRDGRVHWYRPGAERCRQHRERLNEIRDGHLDPAASA